MKMTIPRALINAKTVTAIFENNDDVSILSSLHGDTIMDMGWLYYIKETTVEAQVAAIRKAVGVSSETSTEQETEDRESTNFNNVLGGSVVSFRESPKCTEEDIGKLLCVTEILDDISVYVHNAHYDDITVTVYAHDLEVYKEYIPKYEPGWMDFGVDEIGSGISKTGTAYVSFSIYEYHNSGTQMLDITMLIPERSMARDIERGGWNTDRYRKAKVYNEKKDRFVLF